MAKPDWGVLQNQFLADHAETGISPKEWCDAQGLNYTSARRYIKKPAAQKTAQKKARTAQAEQAPTTAQHEQDTNDAQADRGTRPQCAYWRSADASVVGVAYAAPACAPEAV